jgi:hypothetical protein
MFLGFKERPYEANGWTRLQAAAVFNNSNLRRDPATDKVIRKPSKQQLTLLKRTL